MADATTGLGHVAKRRQGWDRLIAFGVLCSVLFPAMASDPFSSAVTEPLGRAMTELLEWLSTLSAIEASARGNILSLPAAGVRVLISNDCVSMPAYATLLALEFAVASRLTHKLLWSILACLAYLTVNVTRIFSLILVQVHLPPWYDFLHVYFWNFVLFVLVTTYVTRRLLSTVDSSVTEALSARNFSR